MLTPVPIRCQRRLYLALLGVCLGAALTLRANDSSLEQKADDLLNSLVKSNNTGVAVLVAQNGKIVFEKGYGLEDRENKVPVSTETKFRIGSITKQFTAAAILKLQEQGKLSVDHKLSKYIPDFPRGEEVKLHHLLTHTSGIHSYTDKPDFMSRVTNAVTTEEIVKSIKEDSYDFDPGEKWHYNNSGYMVLGYIVEKVSGQSYGDFLRKTFFQPLGMTNTGIHRPNAALTHEALGYSFEKNKMVRAVNWDMGWAGGAGAIYSTVEDLYRWNEGVFNGKVLSEASRKAAFTPVETRQGESATPSYGYGLAILKFRGLPEISHNGGLNGFTSSLIRFTKEHVTVVVLANCVPPHPKLGDSRRVAQELATIYLSDKLSPLPVANTNVSPNAFDGLVGRYDYGPPGVLTVTRDGAHLFAQMAGERKHEIFPLSETEFFWKVVEARVTFEKDANGKVTKAVHRQNDRTINAPRLPESTAKKSEQ